MCPGAMSASQCLAQAATVMPRASASSPRSAAARIFRSSAAASSRWEFTPDADGASHLAVEFTYDLPGGLAGRALGKIVEPFAVQAVKNTEANLRKQLEEGYAAAARE